MKLKKFAVLFTALTLAIPYVYADGDDDVRTIPLKETNGNGDPTKLNEPSRVRISVYYDGSSIILTSTAATMADVEILDETSGLCFFSGQVALAPDFYCPVTAFSGSSLKITVVVGSKFYEGYLRI